MGKQAAATTSRTAKASKVAKPPKSKCCVSSTRCGRCPIRMLQEGTLPAGYAVKKRRLVQVDPQAAPLADPGKAKKKSKNKKKAKKKAAARRAMLDVAA